MNRTFISKFLRLIRQHADFRMLCACASAALVAKLLMDPITPAMVSDLTADLTRLNPTRMLGLVIAGVCIALGESAVFFRRNPRSTSRSLSRMATLAAPFAPAALAVFVSLYLPHPLTWLICFTGFCLHRITRAPAAPPTHRTEVLDALGFGVSASKTIEAGAQPPRTQKFQAPNLLTPSLVLVVLALLAILLIQLGAGRRTLLEAPILIASALSAAALVTKNRRTASLP